MTAEREPRSRKVHYNLPPDDAAAVLLADSSDVVKRACARTDPKRHHVCLIDTATSRVGNEVLHAIGTRHQQFANIPLGKVVCFPMPVKHSIQLMRAGGIEPDPGILRPQPGKYPIVILCNNHVTFTLVTGPDLN